MAKPTIVPTSDPSTEDALSKTLVHISDTRSPEESSAQESAPALRIVRIRRHSAVRGGSYCYHHADVLAESADAAIDAAVERRVTNWRSVDSFNPGQPEAFSFFEVLEDHVAPERAVNAAAPGAREAGMTFKKAPDFIGDNGFSYPQYANRVQTGPAAKMPPGKNARLSREHLLSGGMP